MRYRLKWLPKTVEDIESITEYIEKEFSSYAQAMVSKVLEAT